MTRALNDEILDSCEDMINIAVKNVMFVPDDKKAEALAKLIAEDGSFTYWFKKFELRLEENEKRGNKNGLFVGDAIDIGDLKMFAVLAYMANLEPLNNNESIYKGYERLNKFFKFVNENEAIKGFDAKFKENCDAYKADSAKNVFKYDGKFCPSAL